MRTLNRTPRRFVAGIASAALLAVPLAACGTDDSSSSSKESSSSK